MTRHRWGLACLAATSLIAAACGRGDDSSDTTTAPPATTPAPATSAAPATDAPDASATGAPDATTAAPTTSAPTTTEPAAAPGNRALTAAEIAEQCASEPLQATDVGVSATEITIEVMADTGSPLAPGFGQGTIDAVKAFGDYINANGGIGCRQVVVRTWDSKFDPLEAKNGQIDACTNAFAMVGNYSVLNPDPTPMEGCEDMAGNPTGLPNVAALSVDQNESCSPMTLGVNTRAEPCPLAPNTPRDFVRIVGPTTWLLEQFPGLHGVYLANGDLPSTKLSAVADIEVQQQAGVVWDAKLVQSARDEQSAYIPRVQYLKNGSNFVWHGVADYALVQWMKEAVAQGVDMDEIVWACGVACYTSNLIEQGGSAVEGVYIWIPTLPFEESDTNEALDAYVTSVGDGRIDYNGVQSWQAAIAFQQVVNQIVMEQGPNAITRASLIAGLQALDDFTGDGITGPHPLTEPNPCFVLVQVQDGAFARVWPEERGTLDCKPENLGTVTVNPEQDVETIFTS
jgi:ABC-type branched-subunit amino acid transport system substrate-binding protein